MKNIITKSMYIFGILLLFNTTLLADKSQENVANGAKLWSDVCMRCHNIRMPHELSKNAWEYSMNHMRVRAGLTGKETRDILSFIQASK